MPMISQLNIKNLISTIVKKWNNDCCIMLIDRITHFLGKRREIINRLRILHIIDHFYPVLGYQETFLAKAHSRDDEVLTITSDRYVKALYIANKSLLKRSRSSEASHVVRYPFS